MMTASGGREGLSPTKRALIEVRELRAKLAVLERTHNEAIAVVGIGCRYPGGVDTPESFWEMLREGRDGITEVCRHAPKLRCPDQGVEPLFCGSDAAVGAVSSR